MRLRKRTGALVGLACGIYFGAASADETLFVTDPGPGSPLAPIGVTALPAGGFAVSGRTATNTWLARYSAQGTLVSLQRVLDDHIGDLAARSAVFGESLTEPERFSDHLPSPTPNRACRTERNYIDLRRVRLGPGPGAFSPGNDGLDRDGGKIVHVPAAGGVFRFGPDCQPSPLYFGPLLYEAVQNRGGVGAYALDRSADTFPTPLTYFLRRLELAGQAWEITLPPPPQAPHAQPRLYSSFRGEALVYRQTDENPVRHELTLFRANGSLGWRRIDEGQGRLVDVLADPDGTRLVHEPTSALDGSQGFAITSLGDEGEIRWTARLHPPRYTPWRLSSARSELARPLLTSPQGEPAALQGYALVRPGSDGLAPLAAARSDLLYLAELRDGSLLAKTTRTETPTALVLISPAGTESPVPLPQVPRANSIAGLLDDDHGSVVAVATANGDLELHHLSRQGELSWRTLVTPPANATSAVLHAEVKLAANPTRLCLWRLDTAEVLSSVTCFSRADGTRSFGWVAVEASRDAYRGNAFRVAADDSVDLVGTLPLANGGLRATQSRIASEGHIATRAVLAEIRSGEADLALVEAADGGGFALATMQNQPEQTRLSVHSYADGIRWQTDLSEKLKPLALADDGSVVSIAPGAFVDFDATGHSRWRYSLPIPASLNGPAAIALSNGDRLVQFADPTSRRTHRVRLSQRDGGVQWERSIPTETTYRLSVSPDERQAFALPDRTLTKALGFDLETGAVRASVSLPLPNLGTSFPGPGYRLALRNNGAALLAADDPERGQIRLDLLPTETTLGSESDRLQPSLLGAWSATDTPGQGFLFDVDPVTRDVHGGWFTYSRQGGHDAAEQRWYSLAPRAASASAETASIELAIYRNSGGQFASAPSTTAEQVGRASLRQIGCDRALLTYRFLPEHEDGKEGAIALRRTYPRTRPCLQSPEDQAGIAQAARGLDPRSSGIWHSPERSGQGLMFDLRPPQGSDPGLFAGAWFTYDPSERSDDPTSQHWFSLAGDLSAASEGRVQIPIYRTIGGALDQEATNNTWRVGTATLQFSACDRASLDYVFDQTEVAHAFAGRRGTLSLQRIGGCGD